MYINFQTGVPEDYELPENVYVKHCNLNDLWYRGSQGTGKTILKCNFVVNGLSNKITATGKELQLLQLEALSIDYNWLPRHATKINWIIGSKLINSKILVRSKFNKTTTTVIES